MHSLDEVERLKKVYRRWGRIQWTLGALPVFAVINRFQPMLTDGFGGDLLPTLLPEALGRHYNLMLVVCLVALAASELMRRRFHARHKEDLAL